MTLPQSSDRKPKLPRDENAIVISLPMVLVDSVAFQSRKQRRKLSTVIDIWVNDYLRSTRLTPLPEGTKLKRMVAGKGESKLRRYTLLPETIAMLKEAEELGYSQSFIVEEAIKEGLADAKK